MKECLHCGTEFSPSREGEKFCCRGCEFVHQLITEEGLTRFYDLQAGNPGQPARDRPFLPVDYSWLEESVRTAEEKGGSTAALRLHLRGISCVGCVWLVEKVFLRRDGALRADVFPTDGRLELAWETGSCDIVSFAGELQRFGYAVEPWSARTSSDDELRALAGRLGLCGAFAMNAMVFTLPRYLGMADDFAFAPLFEIITLVSATFALLVGGSYFVKRAWAALRQRTLHIDLPIALGILLAFAGSLAGWALDADRLLYFDFVAIFTFLMLGGRCLHLAAAARVRNQMQGQGPLPESVELADGSAIPLDELSSGQRFRLRSGAVLPVASLLEESNADFSLAWITGEPDPAALRAGRRVPAGAVNLNRDAIVLRAEEAWSESLVAALSERADTSGRSLFLEKILRFYLGAVLALAIIGGVCWWLASGAVDALQVAISICVVSCPCALGVAIPLADRRAAASLQKIGVFIQRAELWERLRRVRRLLLDKTGTLTMEHPQLQDPSSLATLDPEARLALAALSAGSLHPLSRSLLQALGGPGRVDPPVIEELPGKGSLVHLDGTLWSLGRPGWKGDPGNDDALSGVSALACDLRREGELVGRFEFVEAPRPDAREALRFLRRRFGIHSSVISGDSSARVRRLAESLDIDPADAHGDLSPAAKADLVRDLDHRDSLYLGDGANDSFAFDAALATGTPVADRSVLDHKTDFFFTTRGLGFLPALFATASWRGSSVRRIFAFAVSYNIAAVVLCLAGLMTPLLAAVLMPLSSLICLALAARPLPAAPMQIASPELAVSTPRLEDAARATA